MKKTKKLLAIMLIAAMLFVLAGCAEKAKAEDTVKEFCEAMKAFDLEKISSLVSDRKAFDESEYADMLGDGANEVAFLLDYLKENAAKMEYEIVNAREDGEKGIVSARFQYVDASDVVSNALTDYISKAIGLVFSGASEEELKEGLEDSFKESIKTTDAGEVEAEVEFSLTKTDGKWMIDKAPVETASVMLSNIDKAMDDFANIFGS